MKKMLLMTMLIAAIVGLAGMSQAADPIPFATTITVPTNAAGGTYTYSASIRKDYASSFKILAVLTPSTAGTTNTVKVVDGTVTNTIGTKVSAANDTDLVITNDWYHFRGDKVIITTDATNSFTATIIGIEE